MNDHRWCINCKNCWLDIQFSQIVFIYLGMFSLGRQFPVPLSSGRTLNDCSTCASGSSGKCEEDKYDCENLPWYRDDLCGDDDYVAAGKNGCVKCKFIRKICAKSCNWCTIPEEGKIKTTGLMIIEDIWKIYIDSIDFYMIQSLYKYL